MYDTTLLRHAFCWCLSTGMFRHVVLVALMMEAVSTSETSANFYQTTWRNIPEDSRLHTNLCDNLKHHASFWCSTEYVLGSPKLTVSSTARLIFIGLFIYFLRLPYFPYIMYDRVQTDKKVSRKLKLLTIVRTQGVVEPTGGCVRWGIGPVPCPMYLRVWHVLQRPGGPNVVRHCLQGREQVLVHSDCRQFQTLTFRSYWSLLLVS
jgi:hypothetical protein